MSEPKWIIFREEVAPPEPRKTKLWHVLSKTHGNIIGEIRWYAGWRRYALYPGPNTAWDDICLRDVAQFCQEQTVQQKAGRHLQQRPLFI